MGQDPHGSTSELRVPYALYGYFLIGIEADFIDQQ